MEGLLRIQQVASRLSTCSGELVFKYLRGFKDDRSYGGASSYSRAMPANPPSESKPRLHKSLRSPKDVALCTTAHHSPTPRRQRQAAQRTVETGLTSRCVQACVVILSDSPNEVLTLELVVSSTEELWTVRSVSHSGNATSASLVTKRVKTVSLILTVRPL